MICSCRGIIKNVKDLGVNVIIDSRLTYLFEDHITHKVNEAYSVLGIIRRNFEQIWKEPKDEFVLLNG